MRLRDGSFRWAGNSTHPYFIKLEKSVEEDAYSFNALIVEIREISCW